MEKENRQNWIENSRKLRSGLYIYMYVCIHMFVYVCMYVCIGTYVNTLLI